MPVQLAKSAVDLGIVIQESERSLAFYVGLLGLEHVGDMPMPIGGGGTMGGGGKMGGGGACLTINIMGPTYGLDDFEDRVTEAIRDGVRRGGFEDILNTSGDGCR